LRHSYMIQVWSGPQKTLYRYVRYLNSLNIFLLELLEGVENFCSVFFADFLQEGGRVNDGRKHSGT
jgi:hypothetical protein